ncbi:ABC transporter substrate-binding protein [Agaribacterium sp. ZY112]|uniref:ABC transporter substrate-binding protein n=1 Tax=Agaribacterium sp. ZY112 TaxID=3233574 RepID=UPI003524682E
MPQPSSAQVDKNLSIAFYIESGSHRKAIVDQMNHFRNLHPDIELDVQLFHGEKYPLKVEQWLGSGSGPDVLYWHGGQQIKYYSDQGQLKDLAAFWQKNNFDRLYAGASRQAVEFGGAIYGIPVMQQLWGIFYRVSLLKQKGIAVPDTWESMLNACAKAKEQQVRLFAFGAQTPWMAHGWFDYLNLRINGLQYHRALLSGDLSYLDKGVINTLEHWKLLLEQDCFNDNIDDFSRDSAVPLMYHGRALMMLNFSLSRVPAKLEGDFDFAAFPSIDPSIPQYTLAPVEVFIVPTYVNWRAELELMLQFLASADFQDGFNEATRVVSANKFGKTPSTRLTASQAAYLRSSPGGIQYFDRDTRFDFAQHTPEIFIDFMRDRDVKRCAHRLESLRLKVFSQ